ncbi:MAG: hypothetical protein LBQ52_05370 [Helicobacteraceae bacterium]|jgi:hypothetical protein|nr:hypothetical protein [Helicobacteraceae bacterium]
MTREEREDAMGVFVPKSCKRRAGKYNTLFMLRAEANGIYAVAYNGLEFIGITFRFNNDKEHNYGRKEWLINSPIVRSFNDKRDRNEILNLLDETHKKIYGVEMFRKEKKQK